MRELRKANEILKLASALFAQAELDLQAQYMTAVTGLSHHVDHIVPPNGGTVGGLHVQDNLQVLPARKNLQKHNRHWPDMP
jgi:5-methylcytosine-specific restriction endonuclease McrA